MRYSYYLTFMVTIGLIEKDEVKTFFDTNAEYDCQGENSCFRNALAESLNKYRRREDIKSENISLVDVQLLRDVGPVFGTFRTIEITDLIKPVVRS